MKRTLFLIACGALLGGGLVWAVLRHGHGGAAAEDAAQPDKNTEDSAVHVGRDENGRVVVDVSDETQGDLGIRVANPIAVQVSPEREAFGRVCDPAPLAALMAELASAQASYVASSNDLFRLQTLIVQSNASPRALQAAEAQAQRDRLAVQSAHDRLALSSGRAIADRENLPQFIQALAMQEAALIRADVAGDAAALTPVGARWRDMSGNAGEMEFLGPAAGMDSQLQSRGYLFLIKPNGWGLAPGQAVTAFIKMAGEPLLGVVVPRDAVVRTEGKGWVYVLNKNGESFTRTEIDLDHPVENGWLVSRSVAAGDFVVVSGAQALLSIDLSKAGFQAGGRD